MSRSVKHVPSKYADPDEWHGSWEGRYPPRYRRHWGGPRHSVTLYDFRYSSREMRAAEMEGRRPRPHKIRHRLAMYSPQHVHGDRRRNRFAAQYHRSSRTQLRSQLARVAADVDYDVHIRTRTIERDVW